MWLCVCVHTRARVEALEVLVQVCAGVRWCAYVFWRVNMLCVCLFLRYCVCVCALLCVCICLCVCLSLLHLPTCFCKVLIRLSFSLFVCVLCTRVRVCVFVLGWGHGGEGGVMQPPRPRRVALTRTFPGQWSLYVFEEDDQRYQLLQSVRMCCRCHELPHTSQ